MTGERGRKRKRTLPKPTSLMVTGSASAARSAGESVSVVAAGKRATLARVAHASSRIVSCLSLDSAQTRATAAVSFCREVCALASLLGDQDG